MLPVALHVGEIYTVRKLSARLLSADTLINYMFNANAPNSSVQNTVHIVGLF